MKIYVWLPYSFNVKRWGDLSIPLLAHGLVRDWVASGADLCFLVTQKHQDLKSGWFPPGCEFLDVGAHYINGRLNFTDIKALKDVSPKAVVFNFEPINASMLFAAFTKSYAFSRPTIVNYVLFSPLEGDIDDRTRLENAVSVITYPTIFNGPASENQFRTLCNSYVKGSLMSRAKQATIPLGIECDQIDEFKQPRVFGDTFKFLYGGRLSAHKEVERTIKLVGDLYKHGHKVEYTIQTSGVNSCKKLEEWAKLYPFVRPIYSAPRSEFYKNAHTHHAFICASKIETFGLSFFEMMYAGMIGIFYNRDWQQDLLPPVYKVNSDLEAYTLLRHVVTKKESWDKMPGWIRENMNSQTLNASVLDTVRGWAPLEVIE